MYIISKVFSSHPFLTNYNQKRGIVLLIMFLSFLAFIVLNFSHYYSESCEILNAPIEDYPYDADFADASEYYNRLYDSVFNPDSITYTSSLSEKIEYLSIIVK